MSQSLLKYVFCGVHILLKIYEQTQKGRWFRAFRASYCIGIVDFRGGRRIGVGLWHVYISGRVHCAVTEIKKTKEKERVRGVKITVSWTVPKPKVI